MRRLAMVFAWVLVTCCTGERGPEGPKGDKGDPGTPGQQGNQGVQGPPGTLGVLESFYTTESKALSFSGTTPFFLAETAAHVAGANERALLNMQATCAPVGTSQSVAVRGAYRLDAGPDTPVGPAAAQVVGSFPSIPASASNVGGVDLVQGGSYVFSVAVNNSIGGSPYDANCSAALIVMVVKQQGI